MNRDRVERSPLPSDYHEPVMLKEAIELLAVRPGGTYIDATLGGGGYSEALLGLTGPNGTVIGIDRDTEAMAEAGRRFGGRSSFLALHGRFSELRELLRQARIGLVDGIAFDLGVSSRQLDRPERGFSFRSNAPLDMRMDASNGETAAELIARLSEAELRRTIRDYGEERWAARIAQFIVAARDRGMMRTTNDLARCIEAAVPAGARDPSKHPATRTFQALRIAVNREMEELEAGLEAAIVSTAEEGRIVVVSYHSLEDRIVKNCFARWENPCTCPPRLPVCGCGRRPQARVIVRKPIVPASHEVARNPRSRSARLRAAERLRPE